MELKQFFAQDAAGNVVPNGMHLNAIGNAEAALVLRTFVKLPFGN